MSGTNEVAALLHEAAALAGTRVARKCMAAVNSGEVGRDDAEAFGSLLAAEILAFERWLGEAGFDEKAVAGAVDAAMAHCRARLAAYRIQMLTPRQRH